MRFIGRFIFKLKRDTRNYDEDRVSWNRTLILDSAKKIESKTTHERFLLPFLLKREKGTHSFFSLNFDSCSTKAQSYPSLPSHRFEIKSLFISPKIEFLLGFGKQYKLYLILQKFWFCKLIQLSDICDIFTVLTYDIKIQKQGIYRYLFLSL